MAIRICPKCNGKVSTTRDDCPHCGYIFPKNKKCPECEELISIESKECPICGYYFNEDQDSKINTEINIHGDNKIETDIDDKIESISKDYTSNIVDNNELKPIIVETKLDDDKKESKLECPYCHSNNLMMIGINYYMCELCKNKFLDAYTNMAKKPIIVVDSVKVEEVKPVEKISENIIAVENDNITATNQESNDENVEEEIITRYQEKESKSTKSKKKIFIILASILTLIVFGVLLGTWIIPVSIFVSREKKEYDYAMSCLERDINTSISVFEQCTWNDSRNQLWYARARKLFNECVKIETKLNDEKIYDCIYRYEDDANIFFDHSRKNYVYGDEWIRNLGFYVSYNTFFKYCKIAISYMFEGNGEVYVEFDSNGGTSVQSGIISSADIDAYTTRYGYFFEGWSLSNFNFSSNNQKVELSFTAKWSDNNNFKFKENGDGTLTLTGLKDQSITDVRIPSEYNGQPVTAIGNFAFDGCSSITSVVIPDSVTKIGSSAFANCSNLKCIYIPKSVKQMGNSVFGFCEADIFFEGNDTDSWDSYWDNNSYGGFTPGFSYFEYLVFYQNSKGQM